MREATMITNVRDHRSERRKMIEDEEIRKRGRYRAVSAEDNSSGGRVSNA